MSTIANVLKSEIARVARKELKDEIASLRKQTASQRSDIAALKRELKALSAECRKLHKSATAAPGAAAVVSVDATPKKPTGRDAFSAEKLSAHRAKLGLSQAQMAQVIGVSTLSINKWESGKVQPRAAQQAQIAEALKLGKRAVIAKLQAAN